MKRKLSNLSVIAKMFLITFLFNFTQILKSERTFFSTDYSKSSLNANITLAEKYFSSLYKEDFFGTEVEFINPNLPQNWLFVVMLDAPLLKLLNWLMVEIYHQCTIRNSFG
jgi:hypothetical protein